MARDALEHHLDENGEPVFTNLPRHEDGTVDRDRLGGRPYRDRHGRLIDPWPSVTTPDGRHVRPDDEESA